MLQKRSPELGEHGAVGLQRVGLPQHVAAVQVAALREERIIRLDNTVSWPAFLA